MKWLLQSGMFDYGHKKKDDDKSERINKIKTKHRSYCRSQAVTQIKVDWWHVCKYVCAPLIWTNTHTRTHTPAHFNPVNTDNPELLLQVCAIVLQSTTHDPRAEEFNLN